MDDRWDKHFLMLALENAGMSKDPSTKVGAIIVGPDREVRSMGFNGFPRHIEDTHERLHDRAQKLDLVVHGEMNAVLNAVRIGVSTRGCKMYMSAMDANSGLLWGGAPCIRCVVELIQAGIGEIITLPNKNTPERWMKSVHKSMAVLEEAGILYRTVDVGKDYL